MANAKRQRGPTAHTLLWQPTRGSCTSRLDLLPWDMHAIATRCGRHPRPANDTQHPQTHKLLLHPAGTSHGQRATSCIHAAVLTSTPRPPHLRFASITYHRRISTTPCDPVATRHVHVSQPTDESRRPTITRCVPRATFAPTFLIPRPTGASHTYRVRPRSTSYFYNQQMNLASDDHVSHPRFTTNR